MAQTTGRLKFKTFHSQLQGLAVVSVAAGIVGCWLMVHGIHTWRSPANQPPFHPDPLIMGGVALQIGLGAFLILTLALAFFMNTRRSVTITPEAVVCTSRMGEFAITWSNLRAVYGRPDRRFRSLLLTDGTHFFRLESFFFPELALIERVVERALEKESTATNV